MYSFLITLYISKKHYSEIMNAASHMSQMYSVSFGHEKLIYHHEFCFTEFHCLPNQWQISNYSDNGNKPWYTCIATQFLSEYMCHWAWNHSNTISDLFESDGCWFTEVAWGRLKGDHFSLIDQGKRTEFNEYTAYFIPFSLKTINLIIYTFSMKIFFNNNITSMRQN